jgi:hypothetical protein
MEALRLCLIVRDNEPPLLVSEMCKLRDGMTTGVCVGPFSVKTRMGERKPESVDTGMGKTMSHEDLAGSRSCSGADA